MLLLSQQSRDDLTVLRRAQTGMYGSNQCKDQQEAFESEEGGPKQVKMWLESKRLCRALGAHRERTLLEREV